jgi:Tol biopolymer transport system component
MFKRSGQLGVSRTRALLWAATATSAVIVAIVVAVSLSPKTVEVVQNLPVRILTGWFPPRQGAEPLDARERAAFGLLADRLDARIVWSSNREGNHEIYLLDLNAREIKRLTDNSHVDFFSRFSPDGTQILFARSRLEWVSFRDIDDWDIYVMDVDGGNQRLLVEHGYHATWGPQGIVFQRGRQVWEYDMGTGEERLLFSPPKDFPGVLGDPKMSSDGSRLVMATLHDGIGVLDLATGALQHIDGFQACQTDWGPADRSLIWIESEGNGGTRVMQGDVDGSNRRVLMDLPGEYSHEYFPTLSQDGTWMVWGAAAEGHEHDRADYEIFIWEVGEPWDTARRLTFYVGNDQWPDIYVGGGPLP